MTSATLYMRFAGSVMRHGMISTKRVEGPTELRTASLGLWMSVPQGGEGEAHRRAAIDTDRVTVGIDPTWVTAVECRAIAHVIEIAGRSATRGSAASRHRLRGSPGGVPGGTAQDTAPEVTTPHTEAVHPDHPPPGHRTTDNPPTGGGGKAGRARRRRMGQPWANGSFKDPACTAGATAPRALWSLSRQARQT